MFYLETRLDDGHLNNIQMVRLKNKLGTRQLPTAELLLSGTKAYLVGEVGKGVSTISDMLTMSRMYNSLFASSATRRFVLCLCIGAVSVDAYLDSFNVLFNMRSNTRLLIGRGVGGAPLRHSVFYTLIGIYDTA